MNALASHILREYRATTEALVGQEMLLDLNEMISSTSSDGITLSWPVSGCMSYLFDEYSLLDHYITLLNLRDFSFCFSDGALIQLTYRISEGEITYHRLCYFPCPFMFNEEEIQEVGLADLPLLLNADELRSRLKLVTPIRFDYDAEISDEKHAHSHITMNKSTCRVPAYGPVSPGHFFKFILRYFYETQFEGAEAWEDIRPRLYKRSLPYPPPHELHIDTASGYY